MAKARPTVPGREQVPRIAMSSNSVRTGLGSFSGVLNLNCLVRKQYQLLSFLAVTSCSSSIKTNTVSLLHKLKAI